MNDTYIKDIYNRDGFTIELHSDYYADIVDEGTGELFLNGQGYRGTPELSSMQALKEAFAEYWIIGGTYGDHSGQWLHGVGFVLNTDTVEITEDDEYTSVWDGVECSAFVFIKKEIFDEEPTAEQVKSIWRYHDDILQGNVYGGVLKDRDGDIIDSIGVFVGDDVEQAIVEALSDEIPEDAKGYYIKKYTERAQAELEKISKLV